jgi:hypothetical protein
VEISAECRDLLCRTLVADPAQRASMEAIQCHAWFLTNLPPEAVSMNATYLADDDFSGVQTEEEIKSILQMVGRGAGCWARVGACWERGGGQARCSQARACARASSLQCGAGGGDGAGLVQRRRRQADQVAAPRVCHGPARAAQPG